MPSHYSPSDKRASQQLGSRADFSLPRIPLKPSKSQLNKVKSRHNLLNNENRSVRFPMQSCNVSPQVKMHKKNGSSFKIKAELDKKSSGTNKSTHRQANKNIPSSPVKPVKPSAKKENMGDISLSQMFSTINTTLQDADLTKIFLEKHFRQLYPRRELNKRSPYYRVKKGQVYDEKLKLSRSAQNILQNIEGHLQNLVKLEAKSMSALKECIENHASMLLLTKKPR